MPKSVKSQVELFLVDIDKIMIPSGRRLIFTEVHDFSAA